MPSLPRPDASTGRREARLASTVQLSAAQGERLKLILGRFEDDWFDGRCTAIEECLPDDDPVLRRAVLAELVQVELELLHKQGQPVSLEAYLARFPELADDPAAVQSLADACQRLAGGSGSAAAPAFFAAPEGPRIGPGQFDLFCERLVACRLVTREQLDGVLARMAQQPIEKRGTGTSRTTSSADSSELLGASPPFSVERLSAELVRRGLATDWQLGQLRAGYGEFLIDNGRYLLLRQIGQGGMGAVFQARHTRLGLDKALKVIDPKRVNDQALIQRFRREIEVCSRLEHENIVHADDVGQHAGTTFLVLEYVDGADLATIVKRDGPMSAGRAADICAQAAAGLAYAHAQGIIHRDIKPQNLLLSKAGVVKILDMGLARITDQAESDPHTSLTGTGAVMGTVDYMSPEQASDTKSADARSDLYSLGATLYYLLAGRPPFAGGAIIDKLKRLALEEPEPLSRLCPDCPQGLAEIAQRLLAKRPAERFASAAELLQGLARVPVSQSTATPVARSLPAENETQTEKSDTATSRPPFPIASEPQGSLWQRPGPRRGSRVQAAVVTAIVAVAAVVGIWLALKIRPQRTTSAAASPAESPGKGTSGGSAPLAGPADYRAELTDHFAAVTCVALSPDGRTLATGSADGDVRLRDVETNKMFSIYRAHRGPVCGIVWSNDGRLLASASDSGEVHIHKPGAEKPQRVLRRTPVGVMHGMPAMQFSPDDNELACYSSPAIVRYDVESGKSIWVEKWSAGRSHALFAYSPDARYLALGGGDYLAVHDLWSGEIVLEASDKMPHGDQRLFVPRFLGNNTLAVARSEVIEVWDVGEKRVVLGIEIKPREFWNTKTARFVEFSRSGEEALVVTKEETRVYSVRSGEVVRSGGFEPQDTWAWCVSPRLDRVVHVTTGGNVLIERLFDPASRYSTGLALLPPMSYWVSPSCLGGRFVRYGGYLIDVSRGELHPPESHPNTPWITPDGELRHLAWSDTADTEILYSKSYYDREPHRRVPIDHRVARDGGLAWVADGSQLCSMSLPRKSARFFDAQTGQVVRELALPESGFDRFGVSTTGKYVTGISGDGKLALLGESVSTAPRVLDVSVYFGGIFAPGDRHFAALSNISGKHLSIREIPSGRAVLEPKLDGSITLAFLALDFSPDGRYALVDRQIYDLSTTPPARVWECPVPTRAPGLLHASQHRGSWNYRGGALLADNTHAAIAQDGRVDIWNWRDNTRRATLYFLPDGEWAFVNHETRTWNGSTFAFKHLRLKLVSKSGKEEWLRERDFEKRTGWKNDATRAGLDLSLPAAKGAR